MSYRIEYGTDVPPVEKSRGRGLLIVICIFALMAVLEFTGLRQKLLYQLLPGDPQVTAQALEAFARDLRAGDSAAEAFSAFCREIIAHGS